MIYFNKVFYLLLLISSPLLYKSERDFSFTIIDPCQISNEINSIPNFKEGNQTAKSSFADGRYYEWVIEFDDDVKGRLFQGGNSLRYFIEDSTGRNYYYKDKKTAIRALYIYKKYSCISSKDKT